MIARKLLAFLKRDFLIESTYKISFFMDVIDALLPLLIFYFLSRLIDAARLPGVGAAGYFPFVLVGLAVSQYFTSALETFSSAVSRVQMSGCLEAMLSSRTRPAVIIIYSSVYSFFYSFIHLLLTFIFAAVLFKVKFHAAAIPAALVIFVLAASAFSGLGIISAAIILISKKGNPLQWLFGSAMSFLSGVFFPVELFPGWLQKIAAFSPLKHALDGVRAVLFNGTGLRELWHSVLFLAVMAAVLVPLGIWSFQTAVARGRRDGSLMKY